MAYALYLRKSRADEELGHENTLARHEEMLRDLADRNNIYVDEAHIYREIVSGESIEARPQMQRLLKAVEAGMYTGVLCIELERLSRGNGADQARILKSFQFSDTKIITLTKTYDLAGDDSFDEEFFEFGLFMSRREYKMIKRRLHRGRMQAQQEGYFIGSVPPYGYGKRKDGKGWTLCPDPSEAQVVRLIFNRYAQGAKINDILRELQASGVRQRTGNDFTRTRIGEILRNRTYLGELQTKRKIKNRRIIDGEIKETYVRNSDMEYVQGRHEPIVSADTFEQCAARLRTMETRTRHEHTNRNPLASLAICSQCGKTMQRTNGAQAEYLICKTFGCTTKSTKLDIVERLTVDAIQAELERLTYVWAGYETEAKDNADEMRVLESEIDRRQKMLDRACEAYETGIYDRSTYLQRVQKVNAEKVELTARLEALQAAEPERDIKRIPILSKALDEYWGLDRESRNRLLRGMAERVEYEKTERGTWLEPRIRVTLRI